MSGHPTRGVSGSFDITALGQRLREARLAQHLTLNTLATRSGVSRSMISAIERGGRIPTIVVLHRVVAALGMRMSDLMAATPDAVPVIVLRQAEQPVVVDPAGWERRNLAPPLPGLGFEFMRTTLPPGVDAGLFPAHAAGTREHVVVSTGCLTLTLAGVPYHLAEGDAVSYAADCEHGFTNPGPTTCVYYLALVEHHRDARDIRDVPEKE